MDMDVVQYNHALGGDDTVYALRNGWEFDQKVNSVLCRIKQHFETEQLKLTTSSFYKGPNSTRTSFLCRNRWVA